MGLTATTLNDKMVEHYMESRTMTFSNQLADGEFRTIRSKSPVPSHFSVVAVRDDGETPWVLLIDKDTNREYCLTDIEAHDLIDMCQRALRTLPTSK